MKLKLALPSVVYFFAAGICFLTTSFAQAQVVQLPSYRNFSYSGGALVPDQGSAAIAGNSYASSGTVSRGWGPYSTRASGSTFGTSQSSVSVQIIDLRALDDAILSSNVDPSAAAKPVIGQSAIRGSSTTGRNIVSGSSSTPITPLTDPGKWQRVLAGGQPTVPVHTSLAEADIRFYLKMGQEAEAANRVMASRVYYRMAVEAMTPDMVARYEKILADRKEAEAAASATTKANGRQRF